MSNKISILFHAKSSRALKNGLVPIYLRITINGERLEITTGKYSEKSKWIPPAGKIKGNSEETRLINSYLDILRNKVYETEKWMVNNNQEINAQTFKNKLLTANTNVANTYEAVNLARIKRDKTLYKDITGVYNIQDLVKEYVKSAFTDKSIEYKQMVAIKFKKPANLFI